MESADLALSEVHPQICNVIAELARTCDVGGIDSYLALLTGDVVFEFPDNPQVGLAAKAYAGISEVRAGVQARRAAGLQGPGTHTLHLVSTVSARVEADTVSSVAYWTYYVNTHQTPELRSMGQYDDTFRRTGTGWRLSHRVITII